MQNKLPLDDKDGLIITVSVMRRGTGHEINHYMEEKHLQSEGELVNIITKAVKLLWESKDMTTI